MTDLAESTNLHSPPDSQGIVRIWTNPRAINLTDEELDTQIPLLYRSYRLNRKGLGEYLVEKHRRLSCRGCKGEFSAYLARVEIPRSSAYEIMGWYNDVGQLNTVLMDAAEIEIGWAKMRHPPILKSLHEISSQLNGRVPTADELTTLLKPFSTHEEGGKHDTSSPARGDAEALPDSDAEAVQVSDEAEEAVQDTDAEPDLDSNADAEQNTDEEPDQDSDADADQDTDAEPDLDSDADDEQDTDEEPDQDCDEEDDQDDTADEPDYTDEVLDQDSDADQDDTEAESVPDVTYEEAIQDEIYEEVDLNTMVGDISLGTSDSGTTSTDPSEVMMRPTTDDEAVDFLNCHLQGRSDEQVARFLSLYLLSRGESSANSILALIEAAHPSQREHRNPSSVRVNGGMPPFTSGPKPTASVEAPNGASEATPSNHQMFA